MADLGKYVKQDKIPVNIMPDKYEDKANSIPEADKFVESSLPKAPDPSPFKLGPL